MKTLLDIDYVIEGNCPIIRLFYKDSEKGNIVEYVKDFWPYFYAIPKEGCIENLNKEIENLNKKINKIKKIERVRKIFENKEIEVMKIYLYIPTDVKEVRELVRALPSCEHKREADITFTERYLIDSNIVPMENAESQNLKISAIDIETYNPKIESRMDKDEILMISYADNKGIKKVFSFKNCGLDFVVLCNNEKDMLEKFLNFFSEQDVDIIVTFNGDAYDLAYIKERGKIYKINLNFGKFLNIPKTLKFEKRGIDVAAYFTGMPHIDLFPISRQLFSLTQYTLDNVYYEIFKKKGKIEIDKSKIYEIWDNADVNEKAKEDLKKLFYYSLRDSEITLEIALALLPLYYEICRIIKLPLYETTRMGSGMRVERLLMNEAFKKNLLIPNRPPDEEEIVSYEGGFVLEPKKGLHNNIVIFDFRSLYPSIILSYNIDPFTMNCKCCEDEIKEDDKLIINNKKYWFCRKKEGFIPSTIKFLVERRIELKTLMKKEKEPTVKKILDIKQQALKILINSVYGYMGFSRARWHSKECAASVTAYGRKYIQMVINESKNNGFEVIYGDTDSVFITKLNKGKEEILNETKKFLDSINASLPGIMELEFQGFYPSGIFITKKRYALIDENDVLIIKGLETRRRDWANIAKEVQRNVLYIILKENDPKKAIEYVRKKINDIKEKKVKKEDLIIYTKLTRSLDSYIQKKEPHVSAVERAIKKGLTFSTGDIVGYIITKQGKAINEKATIAEFVEEGNYDDDYYINNQILPPILRIMDVFGYSEDKLKHIKSQMTLF